MDRGRAIGLLGALYFVEGLPFGFQATALPAYLRASQVSLEAIGLAGALSLPWLLKVFIAPWVDGTSDGRWGRRRRWILPCQLGLALACFAAATLPPERGLGLLLAAVFAMNAFAATMDIAVDGLAVDWLEGSDLGLVNAGQVVGYKLGMMTGGGLLVWLAGERSWGALTASMGGLVLAVLVLSAIGLPRHLPGAGDRDRPPTWRTVLARLREAVASRTGAYVLLLAASYKTGETLSDAMLRPFLIDAGIGIAQLGLWLGTYGMVFSLAGSLAGGWLSWRRGLEPSLAATALLRLLPLVGLWWVSGRGDLASDPAVIQVLICAEGFAGGALTTAMFALMMSRVDREIGATHFTLYASVEVLGKMVPGWLSGFIAAAWGYSALFASAVVLSALFVALLAPLFAKGPPAGSPPPL